jgi:3-deoxy-D-manno-octulosonate 8-phosphate phosphatase (KDO 8-P phosphatase)
MSATGPDHSSRADDEPFGEATLPLARRAGGSLLDALLADTQSLRPLDGGEAPLRPPTAPALGFAPELLLRAFEVRLLILDVDGVLTDRRLYYGADGEALKVFDVQDGHGIKRVQQAGVEVAIISGRSSPMVERRARDLGIRHCIQGREDKLPVALDLLATLGLGWQQAAMVGDDWPDAPLLRRVALALAPADAHAEIRALVDWVLPEPGGRGAVRSACDLLQFARRRYLEHWREAQA